MSNISEFKCNQINWYKDIIISAHNIFEVNLYKELQIIVIIIMSVLPKGRSLTANSGTKAVILPKGRSSTAMSGTKAAVLLGI